MNSEQLKYFISVAKYLNFTEAAKEFYMTQPAISHQISELEHDLGTRLFERTTRNVSLTKSGTLFLDYAKRLLDLEELSREKIKFAESAQDMQLSISFLLSPCKHFLPELIHRFCSAYPQVKVTIKRHNAQEILDAFSQTETDIYFSMFDDLKFHKRYACRKLFADPFCLVCRNDHPCLDAAHIDYDKLATEPFLLPDSRITPLMTKQIFQVFRDLNISPRTIYTFSDMEETIFAAEAGLGVSILPYKTKDYMSADLSFIPLNHIPDKMEVGAAWLEHSQNQAITWFIQMLNQMMELEPERF